MMGVIIFVMNDFIYQYRKYVSRYHRRSFTILPLLYSIHRYNKYNRYELWPMIDLHSLKSRWQAKERRKKWQIKRYSRWYPSWWAIDGDDIIYILLPHIITYHTIIAYPTQYYQPVGGQSNPSVVNAPNIILSTTTTLLTFVYTTIDNHVQFCRLHVSENIPYRIFLHTPNLNFKTC